MFRAADHVIRHEQELLVLDPGVLGKDLGQFGHRPHGGDVLQDQVQDRHEVRLARTEAPVQVARLAVDGIDRRPDEAQGVVEAFDELGRDHVLLQRLLGLGDALGEVEYEVALADPFRQDQQFADELVHRHIPRASNPQLEPTHALAGSGFSHPIARGFRRFLRRSCSSSSHGPFHHLSFLPRR